MDNGQLRSLTSYISWTNPIGPTMPVLVYPVFGSGRFQRGSQLRQIGRLLGLSVEVVVVSGTVWVFMGSSSEMLRLWRSQRCFEVTRRGRSRQVFVCEG